MVEDDFSKVSGIHLTAFCLYAHANRVWDALASVRIASNCDSHMQIERRSVWMFDGRTGIKSKCLGKFSIVYQEHVERKKTLN